MVNLLEKIYPYSMLHLVAFSDYLSKQLLCIGTFQGVSNCEVMWCFEMLYI